MSATVIEQIEQQIQSAKVHLVLDDALERLLNNADFKKIISEGYFRDEAVRLVHLKADPGFQKPEQQASIVAQIDAIGALSSYFRTLQFNARQAAKEVENHEAELQEILNEDAD